MTFSAVAQGWRTLIPTYRSTNRWGLTYSRGSKGFVNLGSLYQDFGVVAAWIIICGLQHDGGICPRTHDNRVYSPKEDKTASYQRRCRCSQSRLRVNGEQFVRISALCETLAFNRPSKRGFGYRRERKRNEESYADEITKPLVRTHSIACHRNQNLGLSSNILWRRKAGKFFPGRQEKVWRQNICLTWYVHEGIPPLATVQENISPLSSTSPLSLRKDARETQNKPFFLFLITNYFREALMALFELSQSSEAETE